MKLEKEYGFIKYDVDDMNENEIIIELVEVTEKRKGYGTQLVKEVLNIARREGKKAVTLCAYPQDDSITLDQLVNFYEHIGFEVEYDDGESVIMRHDF